MAPGAIVDAVVDTVPGLDTQAATLKTSRFSLNGVPARRAKAPKISGGVAAHASSAMFKSQSSGKPMAKRWDHRLSLESRNRIESTLKGAIKHLKNPNVISLGGGLPTSDYFPFESLTMKVPTIGNFRPGQAATSGQDLDVGKQDYRDGKSLYDIHIAYNYGQSVGSAQLLRYVTEHTEFVHNPPYQDWAVSLTCGSTSSFDMVLRMLCERGDSLLCESYTFCAAVETAIPMGIECVGVDMDEDGMRADSLEQMLSSWDEAARGSRKPHVLYIIPTGQNPTGATQSLQRRRDIYAVAQKHDLLIIEDEPYYFLQMDAYQTGSQPSTPVSTSSHDEFLQALVPSYLSLDVDGRVLRLDSFSKVLAPGSRVGWIVASEQLIERYVRHGEVSTQNPSGMAQLQLYKLLEDAWGHGGFLDWLQHIRSEYTARRDILVQACEEFLPTSVASWEAPKAGMFHWIKIDWKQHPKALAKAAAAISGKTDGTSAETHLLEGKPISAETALMLEIEDELFLESINQGALVARGSWFRAEKDGGSELFFRTTFAAASDSDIREAIRRFGLAIRKSFGIA